MVILADFSDTQLQVTCKRCEQTLQEGDRFCRYCGQDQLEGDPSAVIDITQPASNGDREAFGARPTRQPARREPVLLQDAPGPAGAPDSRPSRAAARSRWSMGLAAVVLLALAGVVSYDLYVSGREGRVPQTSQVSSAPQAAGGARVQEAPPTKPAKPGPNVAETKPAAAPAPGAPAASAAATPPASTPIAKTAPALPAPAPATSAPSAPAVETPSQEGACPPAMAAMALCPNR